ncbi:MAG: universal stress protein [Terriglobales bacterium]
MPNIKKILLPVDIPIASLGVIHQAATLAHHFHSEIVMLHVVTPESHTAGVPDNNSDSAEWDLLAAITGKAQKQQDQSLRPELDGLTIRQVVVKGDPAWAIVQMAEDEKADLIMMPSYGVTFNQFLLGSVTAKVLHGTECPVWTGAHVEESERPSTTYNPLSMYGGAATRTTHPMQDIGHEVEPQPAHEFAIRNILCAVDLGPHSSEVVSWAAPMAAEFGAHLTLAHVTASVEFWGPGGSYVDQKWKAGLVGDASHRIAKLQQDMGIKADVLIGSGDVPNVLSEAVKQTKADLLVMECYPYSGNLRIHGYAIICAVPIPVLSV